MNKIKCPKCGQKYDIEGELIAGFVECECGYEIAVEKPVVKKSNKVLIIGVSALILVFLLSVLIVGGFSIYHFSQDDNDPDVVVENKVQPKVVIQLDEPDSDNLKAEAEAVRLRYNKAMVDSAKIEAMYVVEENGKDIYVEADEEIALGSVASLIRLRVMGNETLWSQHNTLKEGKWYRKPKPTQGKDVGFMYRTFVKKLEPDIHVIDIVKDDSSTLYSHVGYVRYNQVRIFRHGESRLNNFLKFDAKDRYSPITNIKALDKEEPALRRKALVAYKNDIGKVWSEDSKEIKESFYWRIKDKKWVINK